MPRRILEELSVEHAIVDTDVVSCLFKMDTRAQLYKPHLQNSALCISFMTLAELERWAIARHWGKTRREELHEFLADYTMIPPGRALCRVWAEVYEQVRGVGRNIAVPDAWIAATALLYKVPLVTHNRKDYTAVNGLTVISEAP